jgi:hypothetical protein
VGTLKIIVYSAGREVRRGAGKGSGNTTRRRRARAGSETGAPGPASEWATARPAKQSTCAAAAVKALISVTEARMARGGAWVG